MSEASVNLPTSYLGGKLVSINPSSVRFGISLFQELDKVKLIEFGCNRDRLMRPSISLESLLPSNILTSLNMLLRN